MHQGPTLFINTHTHTQRAPLSRSTRATFIVNKDLARRLISLSGFCCLFTRRERASGFLLNITCCATRLCCCIGKITAPAICISAAAGGFTPPQPQQQRLRTFYRRVCSLTGRRGAFRPIFTPGSKRKFRELAYVNIRFKNLYLNRINTTNSFFFKLNCVKCIYMIYYNFW